MFAHECWFCVPRISPHLGRCKNDDLSQRKVQRETVWTAESWLCNHNRANLFLSSFRTKFPSNSRQFTHLLCIRHTYIQHFGLEYVQCFFRLHTWSYPSHEEQKDTSWYFCATIASTTHMYMAKSKQYNIIQHNDTVMMLPSTSRGLPNATRDMSKIATLDTK